MPDVRYATHDDIDAVLRFTEQMRDESPRYCRFPIDWPKSRFLCQQLIDRPEGLLLIAEENGKMIGTMWACLSEIFFSKVCVASDMLVYVEPERRGGSAALRLIRVFEKWGEDSGAWELQLGVSAGIDNDKALAMYRKLGYEDTGQVLTKQVPRV